MTVSDHKWIVIMQKDDESINNGIRLSEIFETKELAESYKQEKEKSDTDFQHLNVIPRRVLSELEPCMRA